MEPIWGSLIGAAVGLALGVPRFALVDAVAVAPAVLCSEVVALGIVRAGATVMFGLATGLVVPTGRPRCAKLTPVRRPSSTLNINIFFMKFLLQV